MDRNERDHLALYVNSARAALRSIAQLSVAPERWVIDGLVALERWTETLTEELRDQAGQLILD